MARQKGRNCGWSLPCATPAAFLSALACMLSFLCFWGGRLGLGRFAWNTQARLLQIIYSSLHLFQ